MEQVKLNINRIDYTSIGEYMDNNEIDVEELMYLTDSRKFLQQSKYKPTK